jgi:hypothetical protein
MSSFQYLIQADEMVKAEGSMETSGVAITEVSRIKGLLRLREKARTEV